MKAKHYSQSEIRKFITGDFLISDPDEMPRNVFLEKLASLIATGTASKLVYNAFSDELVSEYNVVSYMLCQWDKKLKKNLLNDSEFLHPDDQAIKRRYTHELPEHILKYKDYCIAPGTYYIVLKESLKGNIDYAICSISHEDIYFNITVFFLGKHHLKYKQKLVNMVNQVINDQSLQVDRLITFRTGMQTTVFKDFTKIIVNKDKKTKILQYIDRWVENIPYYAKMDIVPKLSILLHGEPGTGKTTLAKAIAKYLKINNVKIIDKEAFKLSQENSPDRKYKGFLAPNHSPTVIVIDDIDLIAPSRDNKLTSDESQLLSCIMEFLDNPPTFYYECNDGLYYKVSIVIATTNYMDRLDEAIKRYGRFDLKIHMDNFTYDEAVDMCSLYHLQLDHIYPEPIKSKKDFRVNPSYLQAVCFENIDKSLKQSTEIMK